MTEEYEAANAALFKALRRVAAEPRNKEAQTKLEEAYSKLEEVKPHPLAPSRWRGSYVKDVKNVSDLRDYAEMMLEITRHTHAERALSVLSDAIYNVDSSFVAWRYPGAPPVSPEPKTDDGARRALLGKLQWLNSIVEPLGMDQAATQEFRIKLSAEAAKGEKPAGGDHLPNEEALFGHSKWADLNQVESEPLRKQLERWRHNNPGSNDFVEVTNRKPNEPQFLYRGRIVTPLAMKLKSSGKRPAE